MPSRSDPHSPQASPTPDTPIDIQSALRDLQHYCGSSYFLKRSWPDNHKMPASALAERLVSFISKASLVKLRQELHTASIKYGEPHTPIENFFLMMAVLQRAVQIEEIKEQKNKYDALHREAMSRTESGTESSATGLTSAFMDGIIAAAKPSDLQDRMTTALKKLQGFINKASLEAAAA